MLLLIVVEQDLYTSFIVIIHTTYQATLRRSNTCPYIILLYTKEIKGGKGEDEITSIQYVTRRAFTKVLARGS